MPHDHHVAPGDHEADELNCFLDSLVAGNASSTHNSPSTLATSARHVHRFADEQVAPRLTPTESDRLWEDLMQTHSVPDAIPFPGPFHRPMTGKASLAEPIGAGARHREARLRLVGSASTAAPAPATPTIATSRVLSLRRRWTRHGWPIVELVGVAALILGLVSVVMGGFSGGDGSRSAVIPMAGVGTATPEETSDEVATMPDPGQTGVMPGPGIDGNPELVWRVPIEDVTSDLFVSDGTLIRAHFSDEIPADFPATTNPWTIEALSARAGTPIWSTEIEASGVQIGGIWQGMIVFVASGESGPIRVGNEEIGDVGQGYVIGLDLATGAVRWSMLLVNAPDQELVSVPTIADGVAYVPTSLGRIFSINLVDRSINWQAMIDDENVPNPEGRGYSRAAVANGIVSLYSSASNSVVTFDAATGERRWALQVTDPPVLGTPVAGLDVIVKSAASVSSPVIANGKVLVTISDYSDDGAQSLMAIDLESGQALWTTDLGSIDLSDPNRQRGVSQPYVTNDAVIVSIGGPDGNRLIASATDTGEQLWELALSDEQSSQMSIVEDTGYVGGADGMLTAVDLSTGDLSWSLELGGAAFGAPFVIDGMIYQAGQDDQLYAIGGSGAAAATPGASTDISGLASCDIEPRAAPEELFATAADRTPALTLVESVYLDSPSTEFPMMPTMAWNDLPVGTPADAEVATAIRQTVEGVTTCTRAGDPAQVAAYFSDDFFSRPYNLNEGGPVNGYFTTSEIPVMSGDLRVMDDGRVGMIATEGLISREIDQNQATLYLFAEQPDGQWLIDEVIIINNSGEAPQR